MKISFEFKDKSRITMDVRDINAYAFRFYHSEGVTLQYPNYPTITIPKFEPIIHEREDIKRRFKIEDWVTIRKVSDLAVFEEKGVWMPESSRESCLDCLGKSGQIHSLKEGWYLVDIHIDPGYCELMSVLDQDLEPMG